MIQSNESSAQDKKERLMQVGFAALMARKKSAIKQYIYEAHGEQGMSAKWGKAGGFVFEPVLNDNEAVRDDFEFMKKKYYSQMVYEGAQAGTLRTSITGEDGPDKQAARRLWAGRKGTGWGGTGKGGYMDSLDPGIPETEGTGLGSVKNEVDALMQAYLHYHKDKMEILRRKSHEATQDLFDMVSRSSTEAGNVVTEGGTTLHYRTPSNWTNYLPPPKATGVRKPENMLWYLRDYLGDRTDFNTDQEWIEDAINEFQREYGKHGHKKMNVQSEVVSNYGVAQGDFAEEILKRVNLTGTDYERMTQRTPQALDKVDYQSLQEQADPDLLTDKLLPEFEDFDDPDADITPLRELGYEDAYKKMHFTGDGGDLKTPWDSFDPLADRKLLTTVFENKSLDQLYPLSWREFKRQEDNQYNEMVTNGPFGQIGKIKGGWGEDSGEIPVKDIHEAERFILWMQKELNDKLAELNKIKEVGGFGTEYTLMNESMRGPNPRNAKGQTIRMDRMGPAGMQPLDALRQTLPIILKGQVSGLDRGAAMYGAHTHIQEILNGFLGDFEMFKSEGGYKMQNYWGFVKPGPGTYGEDAWKLKYESKVARGVDIWVPQFGGYIRVRVQAVIEEAETSSWNVQAEQKKAAKRNPLSERADLTTLHQPYVRLRIESYDFFPDVGMTLEQQEIASMKGDETLKSWNAVQDALWRKGAVATYQGGAMMTHATYGSKIFFGHRSNPVNSVAFYTTTMSVNDFADRLRFLVERAAGKWFEHSQGFGSYFDLSQMEGGAFKDWAQQWNAEALQLQTQLNQKIEYQWQMWVQTEAGGGKTAPPPRIASTWEGPIHLGPFVQSLDSMAIQQSVGTRPHGYYTVDRGNPTNVLI